MCCKPSILRLQRNSQVGFSLIELLVTMFISGVMMTLMTGLFRANVAVRHDMDLQTETQLGLRALFDHLSQELRQAGACLPQQGQFIALDGEDGGNLDSVTLRIGRTDEKTLRCIKAGTTASVTKATTLPLSTGDGDLFEHADLVYVTPNGATGDIYQVLSYTSSSVTLDTAGDFPAGTGIYAIDERIYQIKPRNGRQVLYVQMDGDGVWNPLADGVLQFNVQYWLESTTTPGELESAPQDIPEDDAAWHQVRKLTISAELEAPNRRDGEVVTESGSIDIKPRNLL
jgi:prepilin-type N-terminal cleavage/methylation domain-containing protein